VEIRKTELPKVLLSVGCAFIPAYGSLGAYSNNDPIWANNIMKIKADNRILYFH
jgi:hypothetical protein